MSNIESNLKSICRAKGLSLTDAANRMGTSPSNLLNRVKGNPTVSTVEDIAEALNVSVSELMTLKPEKAQGIAIVDGKTFQLSRPTANTVQLPAYDRYDSLREDVKEFILSCLKRGETASMMAMVEAFEIFSLCYDGHAEKFLLSVCYSTGKTLTYQYDKMEYAEWKEDDTEETVKWNKADLVQDITNDIEGAAFQKIHFETKSENE